MKNKITVFCLSGWAQKPDSLEPIFKNLDPNLEIISFDYSKFLDLDSFFSAIKNSKINPEIIIGWSLGGQLAAKLIADKILNPKLLILQSAPFQFVKSAQISAAMPKAAFDKFKDNFIKFPDHTLKKFALLNMINDKDSKKLFDNLEINEKNHQNLVFWLEELEKFSCYDLNFESFPKTLILHGAGDVVVHFSQSKIFAEKILNSKLEIFSDCGHAVHMNHLDKLRLIVRENLDSIYK